ncbi:MAG: hypothetical protein AAGB12_04230 [Pseudomonadota bacterium]
MTSNVKASTYQRLLRINQLATDAAKTHLQKVQNDYEQHRSKVETIQKQIEQLEDALVSMTSSKMGLDIPSFQQTSQYLQQQQEHCDTAQAELQLAKEQRDIALDALYQKKREENCLSNKEIEFQKELTLQQEKRLQVEITDNWLRRTNVYEPY